MTEEQGRKALRPGVANWILVGLIGVFGVVMFVATVRSGRADSALLFVGLPVLLAVALAITPGRTTHGQVFRITTVILLLAAVALHEGAICVLLAAPLVYLVAHGTTGLINLIARPPRGYAVLPVSLLLLGVTEGTGGMPRIDPDQSVQVVRVVAMPVDWVASTIESGPRPVAVRPVVLRVLGVPVPHHVVGDGLRPGDRWTFTYQQSAHGPGGRTVTEVSLREPGHTAFTFVEDTSITARWFTWQRADLTWRQIDPGHTEVRLTVRYRRGLDPSWYFGPLQDALLHQGAGYLLDTLSLP